MWRVHEKEEKWVELRTPTGRIENDRCEMRTPGERENGIEGPFFDFSNLS